MSRITCILLLVLCTQTAAAQEWNGKNLRWTLDENVDKRIKAFFGTPGRSMGSEEVIVAVENLTDKKIYAEFLVTLTDHCGETVQKRYKHTVPANGKAGGSPWFDGQNFSPKCTTTKQWGDKFVTRIAGAKIELVTIKEIGGSTANSNNNNSNSGNSGNSGTNTNNGNSNHSNNSGTSNNSGNNNSGNYSGGNSNSQGKVGNSYNPGGGCDPKGFSTDGPVGLNCIGILIACDGGANIMERDGTFRQVIPNNNYVVQWRAAGDPNWREERIGNCILTRFKITNLDPCTKYEVRLFRDCGNGKTSTATNATYTTACTVPSMFKATNVGQTTIAVTSRFASTLAICDSRALPVTVVEYKTGSGPWETLFCNFGQGCTIGALQAGTTYRIRSRYQYGNKFSNYSSEILVTTRK